MGNNFTHTMRVHSRNLAYFLSKTSVFFINICQLIIWKNRNNNNLKTILKLKTKQKQKQSKMNFCSSLSKSGPIIFSLGPFSVSQLVTPPGSIFKDKVFPYILPLPCFFSLLFSGLGDMSSFFGGGLSPHHISFFPQRSRIAKI